MKRINEIKNVDNKANFIYACRFAFLGDRNDEYLDFFLDFVIDALQNENGKVRIAALRASEWLGPIYYKPHLRKIIYEKIEKLENLLKKYFQPKFKRYKYLRSLPKGIYKSLMAFYIRLRETERRFEIEDLFEEHKNDKWELYYDAMDLLNAEEIFNAKEFLERAIKIDPDFVAGYVGLTEVYKNFEPDDRIEEYTELAWQKTLKKFPDWPPLEKISWGNIEDRQYFRAICNKAILHHKKGEKEEAEKLYRLLLKLNPNDNQGIRYLLSALFRGLMPEDVDMMVEKGNRKQDWSELENLLIEENKKHKFWEFEILDEEIETPEGNA